MFFCRFVTMKDDYLYKLNKNDNIQMFLDFTKFIDINQDEPNFKEPGCYVFRVNEGIKLDKNIKFEKNMLNNRVVYVGMTEQTLKERFFKKHLNPNQKSSGSSIRRSIGSNIYKEIEIKPILRNKKLFFDNEKRLVDYIKENFEFSFYKSDLHPLDLETELIKHFQPTLNCDNKPDVQVSSLANNLMKVSGFKAYGLGIRDKMYNIYYKDIIDRRSKAKKAALEADTKK
jgi:hypothetical protein